MFNAVVYDTETLGTEPGNQVLSIGAWELNTETGETGENFFCLLGEVIYDGSGLPFIPEQSEDFGLTVDPKCVKEFWDKPEQAEARKIWDDPTSPHQRGFLGGLHAFAEWLGHRDLKGGFWSRGFFDANLVGALYIAAGLPKPWPYWAEADARTLLKVVTQIDGGVYEQPFVGVKHHALDDAWNEGKLIAVALRTLALRKADPAPSLMRDVLHRISSLGTCKDANKTSLELFAEAVEMAGSITSPFIQFGPGDVEPVQGESVAGLLAHLFTKLRDEGRVTIINDVLVIDNNPFDGLLPKAELTETTPYHDLAMRTAAGPEVFHYPGGSKQGQMIVYEGPDVKSSFADWRAVDEQFHFDALTFLMAAANMDRWKSRLFYGKDKPTPNFEKHYFGEASLEFIANPQLIHAILGCATEGAEMVEDLLKLMEGSHSCHQLPIVGNLVREGGDMHWYLELLATSIDTPTDEMKSENIERLAKRFPDKFNEADAVARADEVVSDPERIDGVTDGEAHSRAGASMITIVYGPQASGKTHNGEALRQHFGCKRIVEFEDSMFRASRNPAPLEPGDLVLTNLAKPEIYKHRSLIGLNWRVYPIATALEQLGAAMERAEPQDATGDEHLSFKDELYMTRLENGSE